MGFDLGGEYVRFYMPGTIAAATLLPLYTMIGTARPLAAKEWFYLTDLYWFAPSTVETALVLFDDFNNNGVAVA